MKVLKGDVNILSGAFVVYCKCDNCEKDVLVTSLRPKYHNKVYYDDDNSIKNEVKRQLKKSETFYCPKCGNKLFEKKK